MGAVTRIQHHEGVHMDVRKVARYEEEDALKAFVEFYTLKSAKAIINSFQTNPMNYVNSKGEKIRVSSYLTK